GETGPGETGPGETGPGETGPGETGPGETGPVDRLAPRHGILGHAGIAALAGLALLGLGTGVLLVAVSLPSKTATMVVGGNLPVDAGATNPLDLSSNNSPHLATNPTNGANLAVANRIDAPTFFLRPPRILRRGRQVAGDYGAIPRGGAAPGTVLCAERCLRLERHLVPGVRNPVRDRQQSSRGLVVHLSQRRPDPDLR
ncbi:MAG: hypothetical protein ACRDX8_07630, partial [Acidimicrobiales bacterium]